MQTVDNAMELLRQPLEEGDMQFDFLILSANDLHTPGLQELMDEIDMPLVAYAMDVAALDPTRTAIGSCPFAIVTRGLMLIGESWFSITFHFGNVANLCIESCFIY